MRTWTIAIVGLAFAFVLASASTGPESVQGAKLPDQYGQQTEVAAPGTNTLLIFYRGDW